MNQEISYDNKRARRLRKQADAFSVQPKFLAALNGLSLDPKRQAAAMADPDAFLRKAGLRLPDGLGMEFFRKAPRFLPFPEWTPWVIELTLCRRNWIVECDDLPAPSGLIPCRLKEEEVCLGSWIYPRPWPHGPYSLGQ